MAGTRGGAAGRKDFLGKCIIIIKLGKCRRRRRSLHHCRRECHAPPPDHGTSSSIVLAKMANTLAELPFETIVALRRGLRRARTDLVYGAGNPFRDDEQGGENGGQRIFGDVATHVLRTAATIFNHRRPKREREQAKHMRELERLRASDGYNRKAPCEEKGKECSTRDLSGCAVHEKVCFCGFCETPQAAFRLEMRAQRRARSRGGG